jgi:ABC-2 type transport system permease protein
MNRLIRTELLKQRTSRTFVAGVLAAPIVATLVTIAILDTAGTQGNDPLGPDSLVAVIGGPASTITLIALLLGVLGMAGEYRHQTITTTFLATPRRGTVVLAKLVAHSITGALMALLSLVVSVGIAVSWLLASDVAVHLDGDAVRVAGGLLVSTALYGSLGVSIGALVRNQTTAVTAVLVWLLAVEGIISVVLHDPAFVDWLPAAVGNALVQVGSDGSGLGVPAAAAVFVLYVAGFALAGTRLTLKRDIT